MSAVKQHVKVVLEGPYALFFGNNDSFEDDLPVAEVMEHLEFCKKCDVHVNLGGLMAGDIVAMHTAWTVGDDNTQPVEENMLTVVTNNNALIQFEK